MTRKKGKHISQPSRLEFSKTLLIQESALIWIHSLVMLGLAYLCIAKGYLGQLPWLAVMAGSPWAAYAVSQKAYYAKSEAENTKGGIKYDTVMADYQINTDPFDFDDSAVG